MRNANPLKAGLFIVISFAIAAGIFFGITGTSALRESNKDYSVVFDLDEDVNGLAVGSDVRIGGFIVGSVKSVDVADADGERPTIHVGFRMPAKYPIREDATLIVQAGVTGLVNLNITALGTRTAALATAAKPLDGAPSGLAVALSSFAQIGSEATQTLQAWRPRGSAALDQVKVTAASADQTIQQVRSKIDPAYDKFAGVADSTKGAMASLDEILGGGKSDIRTTLANLRGATNTVNEKLPMLVDQVSDVIGHLKVTLDKTNGAIEDARAIASNGKDITASVRTLITGNRSRFEEIIKSLSFAGNNLAAASSEIRRSPWRLLYKPSEGEVANQNLYDATRQFAEASRKLQDSSMALRDTLGTGQANKEDVQAMLDKLDADFANYKRVESTLWERVQR